MRTRWLERPARLLLIAGLMTAVACGDDDNDPAGPGPPVDITSGTPVTGITGTEGNQKLYRIPVPAGATSLDVTTSGGTGDVDLYVRAASAPTIDDYDCRSWDFGTDESCSIPSPAEGDWYILLDAFEAYSGVTLTATVTTP